MSVLACVFLKETTLKYVTSRRRDITGKRKGLLHAIKSPRLAGSLIEGAC